MAGKKDNYKYPMQNNGKPWTRHSINYHGTEILVIGKETDPVPTTRQAIEHSMENKRNSKSTADWTDF